MCDISAALQNAMAAGSVIFANNSDRGPNEAHELCSLNRVYPAGLCPGECPCGGTVGSITLRCFEAAEEALQNWLEKVRLMPVVHPRAFITHEPITD